MMKAVRSPWLLIDYDVYKLCHLCVHNIVMCMCMCVWINYSFNLLTDAKLCLISYFDSVVL